MNSEILHITRRLGYPSSFGARSGLGDFLEQYPDGIYAETGIGAPIGWESAAVWFGGKSERVAAKFESMVAERNDVSRLFRTRVSGVLVLTFLYRLKKRVVTAIPVGGGAEPGPTPIDEWWGLKLTMPEGGTIILRKNGSPTAVSLETSTDGETWTPWQLVGTDYTYTLDAGKTLHIKNTSTTFVQLSTSSSNYYQFVFDNTVEASGSVMSLSVNDETVLSLAGTNYNFYNLFQGCTSLVSAPALPSTTLAISCYRSMFQGCTSLVSTPALPATTLASNCYFEMFRDCTSLVSAPALPSTTLAGQCYRSMFQGCTSLVSAPTLPATTLASNCYYEMFRDCTSLVSAPALPATTLANQCCLSMFQGCTSLVSAPTLPATTLANGCYRSMFQDCMILSEIRTYMTNISASNCLTNWLSGVSAEGYLYCDSNLTIPTGASGIPSGWIRQDI